jgi:hypothetical protein
MFVRQIGGKKNTFRLYGGTERRDAVVYNGRVLKGYIRVRKINKQFIEETCFLHKKSGELLVQPGVDFFWLAERNSIQLKRAA